MAKKKKAKRGKFNRIFHPVDRGEERAVAFAEGLQVNDSDVAKLIRRDGMDKTLERMLAYVGPLRGQKYVNVTYLDDLYSDIAKTLDNYRKRYAEDK